MATLCYIPHHSHQPTLLTLVATYAFRLHCMKCIRLQEHALTSNRFMLTAVSLCMAHKLVDDECRIVRTFYM